jgi:hypothetical protein
VLLLLLLYLSISSPYSSTFRPFSSFGFIFSCLVPPFSIVSLIFSVALYCRRFVCSVSLEWEINHLSLLSQFAIYTFPVSSFISKDLFNSKTPL